LVESTVGAIRWINIAVAHALPQRVWRHVDQFHLVSLVHHAIRNSLAHLYAGDVLDNVGQALEVLDVDGADHGDSGFEEVLHVLPALFVISHRRVGVGKFIYQRYGGVPGNHRFRVHLLEGDALVQNPLARHRLQASGKVGSSGPAVRLEEANYGVSAALLAAM